MEPAPDAGGRSALQQLLNQPDDPAEVLALEIEREEAVAACMAVRGWDYTPVVPPDRLFRSAAAPATGYGIADGYEAFEAPVLRGEPSPLAPPADDPNLAAFRELGDAEAEAYERALNGSGTPTDPGCLSEARSAIYPATRPEVSQLLAELLVEEEGRRSYVDALSSWADCMRGRGYEVAEPVDPLVLVQGRKDELLRSADEDDPPTPLTDGELQGLRDFEVAVFDADQACRDESGFAEAADVFERNVHAAVTQEFPELGESTG